MKSYEVGGRTFYDTCDVREWTYNMAREEQKKYFGQMVSVDRLDKLRYGLYCNTTKRWVWTPMVVENG